MYDYLEATEPGMTTSKGYTYRCKTFLLMCCFPDHPAHGTEGGYNAGCRCERCKAARKAYDRERYRKNCEEIKARERERYRKKVLQQVRSKRGEA